MGGAARALARLAPSPAPSINFIATNVPGAQVPLYLAGRRMLQMIGCVPLSANLGYNVAIVSYNQSLIFGMMAAPRLMPDVELMRDCASDVFAEMLTLARQKPPDNESSDLRSELRQNHLNGSLVGEN